MKLRKFLRNTGWVSTGLIFVPKLIRAQVIANNGRSAGNGAYGTIVEASGGTPTYHLEEDLAPTPNDTNEIGDASANTYRGCSWTPAKSYALRRVSLYLTKNGSPANNIAARIYAGTGTTPTTQSGSDSDVHAGGTITAGAYNDFTFPGDITITSGTRVWVVAFVNSAGGNYYLFNDNGAGSENLAHSTNGSTWTNDCSTCILVTMRTYSYS